MRQRIDISAYKGGLLLRIGPRRAAATALVNCFAGAIGGFLFALACRMLARPMPATGVIIVGACAAFSLPITLLTAFQALWIMFGSEKFHCDASHLTSTMSLLGLRRTRSFPLLTVRGFRIDVRVYYRRGNRFVQRRFAFESDDRTVPSLSLLTEEDLPHVQSYIDALRELFPALFERFSSNPIPRGDPVEEETSTTAGLDRRDDAERGS